MPCKPALRLLPNYFKKIGFVLIMLTVLAFIFLVTVKPEVSKDTKELLRQSMISSFILALAMIAVSRDRMEDERTLSLRLQAMAFAFIYSVGDPMITPWISKIMNDTWEKTGGDILVLNMQVIYLLVFSFMKYTR